MTAGPGSNPIKNFQDVIDRDINVVARHSTSNHEVLKTAVEGTPMYNYYYDTMHDDPNYFVKVRVRVFISENTRTIMVAEKMLSSVHSGAEPQTPGFVKLF